MYPPQNEATSPHENLTHQQLSLSLRFRLDSPDHNAEFVIVCFSVPNLRMKGLYFSSAVDVLFDNRMKSFFLRSVRQSRCEPLCTHSRKPQFAAVSRDNKWSAIVRGTLEN